VCSSRGSQVRLHDLGHVAQVFAAEAGVMLAVLLLIRHKPIEPAPSLATDDTAPAG